MLANNLTLYSDSKQIKNNCFQFFAKCFKRGRFEMRRNVTQMETEEAKEEQDATGNVLILLWQN